MSSSPATRMKRRVDHKQIVDLFYFPTTYRLGEWLDEQFPVHTAGRKSRYDSATLLAIAASARICGSTRDGVEEALALEGNWERCRQAHRKYSRSGLVLPDRAPSYDQVRAFRARVTCDAQIMRGLQRLFRECAIKQAIGLGNFTAHADGPDWSQPDERRTIYGDGTVVSPFSNVQAVTNPLTGETVLHGSRATDPTRARIQDFHPKTNPDNKPARGVNGVAVHTWTDYGRVCLATANALGAESRTAMDVIDDVVALLGDAGDIDRVIWDRALCGWMIDYLLAQHGIQLQGKSVAASSDNAHDRKISDKVLKAMVDDMAAGLDKKPTPQERQQLRKDAIQQMLDKDALTPLGTSVYETGKGHDLVHGENVEFVISHDVPSGSCRHQVAVDDGALFLTMTKTDAEAEAEAEETIYKTVHLPCVSSKRVLGPDGHGRIDTFEVPCTHGSFEYTRQWLPSSQRGPAGDRTQDDQIGRFLRPISRTDTERFAPIIGRRNDAESFNSQYKETLHKGVAASQTLAGQELDFLFGAVVNNSRTWSRYAQVIYAS